MGRPGPKPGSKKIPGSGRKKGKLNKATLEVKTLAQKHGTAAIDFLGGLLQDDRENIEARIKAAQELLNRGYGRAVGTTQLAGHDGGPLDLTALTLEQKIGIAEQIAKTLAAEGPAKK